MWTAEFELDGSNPDPWLPVRVCNTTDSEVRLRAGEEIGEARTDVQVMRFNDGQEQCHGSCQESGGRSEESDLQASRHERDNNNINNNHGNVNAVTINAVNRRDW